MIILKVGEKQHAKGKEKEKKEEKREKKSDVAKLIGGIIIRNVSGDTEEEEEKSRCTNNVIHSRRLMVSLMERRATRANCPRAATTYYTFFCR